MARTFKRDTTVKGPWQLLLWKIGAKGKRARTSDPPKQRGIAACLPKGAACAANSHITTADCPPWVTSPVFVAGFPAPWRFPYFIMCRHCHEMSESD